MFTDHAQSIAIAPNGQAAAMQAADAALIDRMAAGDKLAMQVFYARHNLKVYRFVLRIVANPSIAEDVANEVFLDVWRQAAQFEGRAAASTWLLAIARFKAYSAVRRRPDEELDEDMAAAIEYTADDPEKALQKRARSEILRR